MDDAADERQNTAMKISSGLATQIAVASGRSERDPLRRQLAENDLDRP